MIRTGFTFEPPTTKTRIVVLERGAETRGMGWLLGVTRYSKPGSNLDNHLQLTQVGTLIIENNKLVHGAGEI